MKENFFKILLLAILAAAVGLLFWHGQKVIWGAPDPGYSVLAFKNSDDSINLQDDDFGAMTFFIQNSQNNSANYEVKMLVDGNHIDSFEKKIGLDKLHFKPTRPLIMHLEKFPTGSNFEFKIVASWGEKEEVIVKKIKIDE